MYVHKYEIRGLGIIFLYTVPVRSANVAPQSLKASVRNIYSSHKYSIMHSMMRKFHDN
jgi:hypothetical protein